LGKYPIIDEVPSNREIEYLVGDHFAKSRYGMGIDVKLGNDSFGIPDVFVFSQGKLISAVELGGYIFGEIEDIRSHNLVNGKMSIDVEKCIKIHRDQQPPFTIVEKNQW